MIDIAPVSAPNGVIRNCAKKTQSNKHFLFAPLYFLLSSVCVKNLLKDEINLSKAIAKNYENCIFNATSLIKTNKHVATNFLKELSKNKGLIFGASALLLQACTFTIGRYANSSKINFACKEKLNSHQG